MRPTPFVVSAALLALGWAATVQARTDEAPRYLTQRDLARATSLPRPPAEGSPAALAEVAELHRLETASTPERRERARWDGEHEDGEMFVPALAPGFDLASLPATARLLEDARHEAKIASSKGKAFYLRKRPWAVDPTLQPCSHGDKPLTSYPSGHSTAGWAMATVLAAAWPAKASVIRARAVDFGESRLVCGAHFRSDVEGGKMLGEAVGHDLLAKPAFKAEERAAARELAKLN